MLLHGWNSEYGLLGVVGLAVARALSLAYPEKSTLLLERNHLVGEETRQVQAS